MDAAIILRQVPRAGHALGNLLTTVCGYLNPGTDAIAIALSPFQLQSNPVMLPLGCVVQERRPRPQVHDESINSSVVVVIGEARAARDGLHIQHGTCTSRNIDELPISHSAKYRVLLRDEVNQPAVENQDVEQTVVVEVVYAACPA